MEFEQLPLHDAQLSDVCVCWKSHSVRITLSCFVNFSLPASPCELSFSSVTSVDIPMKFPWGESNSVNNSWLEGCSYHIEMQSGDVLKIDAGEYSFEQKDL
ncbi:hypothetical protein F9L16_17330 [Agarivorans sp. B2Z047]|uniref:hypothetical protein n=1 Tax=Agarivorans sp. B2Z047 TaxID=2652721 RepID=UPI00128E0A46|nr:hypothetical protein [Agarivorans sp. B2Z047]MPW30750.1 hypothetical protein [Agarivorans sp. B2Z047]UQN42027.1 hypothetical protein LQZ07_20005 [Agarivorans sp. B2Z047]